MITGPGRLSGHDAITTVAMTPQRCGSLGDRPSSALGVKQGGPGKTYIYIPAQLVSTHYWVNFPTSPYLTHILSPSLRAREPESLRARP